VFDHDLSKKTDVYFAANFQKFDNGNQWAALLPSGAQKQADTGGNGLMGQSISYIGAGLRTKF
jgi:predicted porin